MNDKLKTLMSEANDRIAAAEKARESAQQQRDKQMLEENTLRFKKLVQEALGNDVLEALGTVNFEDGMIEPSMTFSQDSRQFSLKTVGLPPGLVQLEELLRGGFTRAPFHPQFSLVQPTAKDAFLHALGQALRDTPR